MQYKNRARPIRKQSSETSGGASHERTLLANKNKAEDRIPIPDERGSSIKCRFEFYSRGERGPCEPGAALIINTACLMTPPKWAQ